MIKVILLKLMPLLIIFPCAILVSKTIIEAKESRNYAIFNGTKKIIKQNLKLSSIQYKEVNRLNYFDAYELEISQLISETDSSNLFNIVITNLDNDVKITNLSEAENNKDAQSREIINHYQNEDTKSKYKVSRINIKSGRNRYGVTNNIGYAYLRYHPQKVQEIEQEETYIIVTTVIILLFTLIVDYFIMSMLLQKYTLDQIINRGENAGIEFKPCFLTDKNQDNRNFEYECAKVISSFLNTNGGYLFIGISDDGEPIGLEDDFKSVKSSLLKNKQYISEYNKSIKDEYIRKIKSKLGKQLNKNALSTLKLNITKSNNVEILIIECPPSRTPTLNKVQKGVGFEMCFRKDSETVIYKDIKYNLDHNQVVPLWKLIVNNFSAYKSILKIIFWKTRKMIIQI